MLLLSLLLVILMHPVLDHGELRKLILGVLMFVPVILATVSLSQIKDWLWPTVLLMSVAFVFGVAGALFPNPALVGTKWVLLTAFFGLAVVGLFSSLKNARSVTSAHLHTAVSIYLLLELAWFARYSAIDLFYPSSILRSSTAMVDRPSELLYFSLITLTTMGPAHQARGVRG